LEDREKGVGDLGAEGWAAVNGNAGVNDEVEPATEEDAAVGDLAILHVVEGELVGVLEDAVCAFA
jgi:hypothetical protein